MLAEQADCPRFWCLVLIWVEYEPQQHSCCSASTPSGFNTFIINSSYLTVSYLNSTILNFNSSYLTVSYLNSTILNFNSSYLTVCPVSK